MNSTRGVRAARKQHHSRHRPSRHLRQRGVKEHYGKPDQLQHRQVRRIIRQGFADSAFDLPRGELRRPLERGQVVYHEQDLQSSQSRQGVEHPGQNGQCELFRGRRCALRRPAGYGFAQRSKGERDRWAQLIGDYFDLDRSFNLVVSLVDIRHDPSKLDHQMIEFLQEGEFPFIVALTKQTSFRATSRQNRQQRSSASSMCRPKTSSSPHPNRARVSRNCVRSSSSTAWARRNSQGRTSKRSARRQAAVSIAGICSKMSHLERLAGPPSGTFAAFSHVESKLQQPSVGVGRAAANVNKINLSTFCHIAGGVDGSSAVSNIRWNRF